MNFLNVRLRFLNVTLRSQKFFSWELAQATAAKDAATTATIPKYQEDARRFKIRAQELQTRLARAEKLVERQADNIALENDP